MAEKTIEERIKDIIADRLELKTDQIIPGASLQEDLGADSLDAVELIMALEEEFGIEIPDDHAEELKTVGDVFSYIQDHLKK